MRRLFFVLLAVLWSALAQAGVARAEGLTVLTVQNSLINFDSATPGPVEPPCIWESGTTFQPPCSTMSA